MGNERRQQVQFNLEQNLSFKFDSASLHRNYITTRNVYSYKKYPATLPSMRIDVPNLNILIDT